MSALLPFLAICGCLKRAAMSELCRPIVFLHGVGFGVFPYLPFIRDMMHAMPENPVVVAEVRHVSLRMVPEVYSIDQVRWGASRFQTIIVAGHCCKLSPFLHAICIFSAEPRFRQHVMQQKFGMDQVAEDTMEALRKEGFYDACFVGHSFGTFVVSRLCQMYHEVRPAMWCTSVSLHADVSGTVCVMRGHFTLGGCIHLPAYTRFLCFLLCSNGGGLASPVLNISYHFTVHN